jgi:uncharacterized protein YjbI with pentapeptide repeats
MAEREKFNWKTFLKAVAEGRKDFSKCMLQGIDLSSCAGGKLQGLDFSDATLEHANFSGSKLSGSNFSRANLKKANLVNAQIDDCDFSEAILDGATLHNSSAKNANFSYASLVEANFNCANLQQTCLDATDLTEASLIDANLYDASIQRANLEKANLSRANLKLAYFHNSELSRACLNNVDASEACFMDANLSFASLNDANLAEVNFFHAILSSTKLKKANLENAHLPHANINDSDLEEANLKSASLAYAVVERANLKKANLVNTNLDNTSLKYSNLDSANLEYAKLNCTKLDDATLTNTNLIYSHLDSVQKSKDAQVNVKSKDVTNPVAVINKEVSKKLIEKVTHVDVHKKEDKMSKAKEIGKAIVFRSAIDESVQIGKAVILELLSLFGVRKNSRLYKFFASEFSNIVVKGAVGLFLYLCPLTQEEKWQNIANELMTQAGFSTLKESIDILLGFMSPHAAKLVGMIEKLTTMQSEVRVDAPEVKARIQDKKEEHVDEEEEVIPLVGKKAIAI